MPLQETHFADETTRESYQLALREMDTRMVDAGLTAVVMLQTSGEIKINATKSGPEGVHKVRNAAKRAGARHGMAADWLRQLARITRGVRRGATIYSGASLTLTTDPGENTSDNARKKGAPRPAAAINSGDQEETAAARISARRHEHDSAAPAARDPPRWPPPKTTRGKKDPDNARPAVAAPTRSNRRRGPPHMANEAMHYGACITYRPVAHYLVGDEPDTRPVGRLPSLGIAAEDTATARDRSLARACGDLESQGYRIEAVERFEHCARCHGTGKVQAKPRGWRKRTAPPWYLMRTVECKHCPGSMTLTTATHQRNKGHAPCPSS